MKTKKIPTPFAADEGVRKTIDINNIPHHYVGIHYEKYRKQPINAEMGKITNDFKKQGFAKRCSLLEIFHAASQGQSILPSNFEVESDYDKGRLGSIRFVSSSLVMIDVDDDYCITDPDALLEKLKDKCAGYFYTFSHGIKGNRYRLVFSLDRSITNENIYKAVVTQLAAEVKDLIEMPANNHIPSPVDTQAKVPTTPIRTGRLQPVISDLTVRVDATEYIEKARREEIRRTEAAKASFEASMEYRTTFEELKEMAEVVGYLPSSSGQGELWKTMVMGIKHYVEGGAITDSEGYELYAAISGPEASNKVWDGFKPNGRATIATLVKFAKDKGYKRKGYRYALSASSETYKKERHKVKEYIPTDLARDFIERNQRLLVESPTGSGKSTSFINASKALCAENPKSSRFYIFSVPTRALATQLAQKYDVPVVIGNSKGLFSRLFSGVKNGVRVFIATYDMTNILMNWISNFNQFPSFVLMVDEYHKTVTDYSGAYRRDTLNELQKAGKKASSFIALSGTPEDILKAEFDQIIEIDNGRLASPCQEFAIYTYEKQKEALPLLVQLIEAWTVKRKLLIYIQSKEVITKLYDLLRKRGIVTRTVSASEKRNNTYKSLVETETVPDDVQVILATSVIADGISIKNSLEWECIVVANHFSDLFNASTLKQISNRFRNEYRRFSIFMHQPIAEDTELFNIDAAYRFIYSVADRFAKHLNAEFSFKDLDLFRASIIEDHYGISADEHGINADKYFIRYEVSKAQERYYKGRRLAFVKAVEKVLHKKSVGSLNISEAVRNKELDLSLIESAISELEQQIELDREARKNGVEQFFTHEIYQAFHDNNEIKLSQFKNFVLPEHYACIKGLYQFASYETCKKIAMGVTRKCDTHAYMNRIRAIVDVWYFDSFNRRTETKRIYEAFIPLINEEPIPSKELQAIMEQTANRQRVSPVAAKKVLNNLFVHERTRSNKEWSVKLQLLTVERIAAEQKLTALDVIGTLEMYSLTQKKVIRTVISNKLQKMKDSQLTLKLG